VVRTLLDWKIPQREIDAILRIEGNAPQHVLDCYELAKHQQQFGGVKHPKILFRQWVNHKKEPDFTVLEQSREQRRMREDVDRQIADSARQQQEADDFIASLSPESRQRWADMYRVVFGYQCDKASANRGAYELKKRGITEQSTEAELLTEKKHFEDEFDKAIEMAPRNIFPPVNSDH
jgi:hypothetical protein